LRPIIEMRNGPTSLADTKESTIDVSSGHRHAQVTWPCKTYVHLGGVLR
jgi:hypothetical protein